MSRNAAAMNFANQFLNNVKACACQYECFLFFISFPFPSFSFLQVLTEKMTPSSCHHAFICSPISKEFSYMCHVIAHGDEEVRLILSSRAELALSSSQKVTVKRECGSQRG